MAAAAVDIGYLAASYSVPESTLNTLLAEPTVQIVQSLLVQIEARAREYDDLNSDKIKAEVELETAIQSGDTRARTLKANVDQAQKEAADLREKLAAEEDARRKAESELSTLNTTASTSTDEAQALASRIKALESQNRDTLAMHEAKVAAHDRLAQELADQHAKYVDVRKQLSALDEAKQQLENAAANVKFRETNFLQEIELLRKNNEWFEGELKTRADDQTRYRKEKNAQVAELQRAAADAADTMDTLRRSETALRQRVEELEQKAEEARARIEQLEDEAAQNQASFRNELDSARRLATLHQESAELVKGRLQQLQHELSTLSDNAAEEVGQLQAEVESERNKVTEAESRIAELESVQETLQSQISELSAASASASRSGPPATPRRGMNASFDTPGRAGSPAVFSPGGSRLKGGMSITQLYSENVNLKSQIRTLHEKSEEKDSTLAEMLETLEQVQPEIDELRRENEVLTSQTTEISALLEEATQERESARKDARKALGDLDGMNRECAALRQQLQDTVTQMRSLLWRRQAEEQGLESLTPDQQAFVQHTVENNNEMPEHLIDDTTATGALITRHLLLFSNVSELQAANEKLMRTIRQVAETHEGQEARDKLEQYKKDAEELDRLRTELAESEDQIKSLTLRSQSMMKERDMYRRIVTSRGHGTPGPDGEIDFSQSVGSRAPATPMRGSLMQSMDQTPHSRDVAGYEKLIKDLQSHLDLLREENATDRASLKQQVDSLTKESNQLQSDKLRLDNQVRREQDRYAHLESNMKLLQSEKTTLQERYSSIQDALAKQDDKVDKAQQEALDAGARAEGLDREIVNLKASQTMWKTIEARLTERNKELTDERDRLSKMVTDIQSLRNEQELTNAENRRRLQDRVDSLEAELQIATRKLDTELAEHKKTGLQRDYERTDSQRRIDDFIKAKNETDVKFASANTARQQLEQRVSELQAQLQSAEERAEVLRPRQANEAEDEEDANPEDSLELQISELQRKIERKQEDLEVAQGQIETFQAIAQEAEDQLRSYTETHERYEEEMAASQDEKDAIIKDLQQRVEEISSELTTTNTELTELRGQHEQETLRLTQQKDALEADINRLKEDVNEYKAEVDNQAQLVASQADIATRAQQDYEHELAKHGETMKGLRNLRDEHNQLKSEVSQFKAQAEAAQTTLAQNEEHWASVKEQAENQVAEMQRNYDGAKQHNKTLLRQFDDFKAQIDALKSNRAASLSGETEGTPVDLSSGLQEIVDYLRREKEILEVQLNLKDQEVKRQEQQLSHTQTQLDQAREKLIAEQNKSQGAQSGTSLQSLQAQIEQLNVYRESTTTLRNENRRLESQIAEKATEIEEVYNKLEPLQARVTELEGEVELHLGHLKAVEEDRDRWQKRHQDVLQRYDRIDPKELEDLKTKIEELQTERDQATGQIDTLKSERDQAVGHMETLQSERDEAVGKVDGLSEKVQAADSTLETAVAEAKRAATSAARQDAKDRFNKLHNQKMATKQAEMDVIIKERDEAKEALASVQQELETARQQASGTESAASLTQEQLTILQQELDQAKNQLAIAQQDLEAVTSARDEALAHAENSGQATANVEMGEIQTNEGKSDAYSQEIERLKAQLTEAINKQMEASNQSAGLHVQLTMVKDKVAELEQKEAEHINRIVELGAELKEAQAKTEAAQPQGTAKPTPGPPEPAEPVPESNKEASAETDGLREELATAKSEVEKLREELTVAKKEVEDLRARVETAEAATSEATKNSAASTENLPNEEQLNATKALLEEREAQVAQLEATLQQRETKVANRESKQASFQEKCNNKIKEIRTETNNELERLKNEHLAEIERVRQVQPATPTPATPSVPAQPEDIFAGTTSDSQIDTESLPRPTATLQQFSAFVKSNNGVKHLLQGLVAKNVDAKTRELTKQVDDLKAALKALNSDPPPANGSSGDLTALKAEHEQALKTALEQKEASLTRAFKLKSKLFEGQFSLLKVRWAVFEKHAKETPAEEVGKVYEIAKIAKDTPAQPATPAKPQAPAPGQTQTPKQVAPQQAPIGTPQANGANTNAVVPEGSPSQPPNPFQQSTGAPHAAAASNPFAQQSQSQAGRGVGTTGIIVPSQQHAGQGRGGFGTGPRALQGIVSNQSVHSGIPRGGMSSSIPLPGGRGAGRGQGTGLPQPPASGLPQPGQAQGIPRGGGRGGQRSGGRGSVNPSPRTSLNPGAAGFQPGAGRGQKRNAEEEADGSGSRGGKRARGGRGGAAVGE